MYIPTPSIFANQTYVQDNPLNLNFHSNVTLGSISEGEKNHTHEEISVPLIHSSILYNNPGMETT